MGIFLHQLDLFQPGDDDLKNCRAKIIKCFEFVKVRWIVKKWTSFRFNLLDGISKRIAQTRIRRTYIPGPSYVAFFQLAFLVWFTIVGQSWSLIRIESVPKTGLPKNQEKLFCFSIHPDKPLKWNLKGLINFFQV